MLFSCLFREGADGTGREFHLHAVHMFGLHIYLESASRRDIGMAALVPDGGSTTGEFTGSTHRISE